MERGVHGVRQVDGRLGDSTKANSRPRLDDNRPGQSESTPWRLHRHGLLHGQLRAEILAAGRLLVPRLAFFLLYPCEGHFILKEFNWEPFCWHTFQYFNREMCNSNKDSSAVSAGHVVPI